MRGNIWNVSRVSLKLFKLPRDAHLRRMGLNERKSYAVSSTLAYQRLAATVGRSERCIVHCSGRRLNLPTDIMLTLFDSCVEPILLYGYEVWGYENVDILEKVHTKFF